MHVGAWHVVELPPDSRLSKSCFSATTTAAPSTLGAVIGYWQCAFALDAAPDVNQYAHAARRNRKGFATAAISSGCEALGNASRHAAASRIKVGLSYDERQLQVRVRDDGQGIDPKFLADEGRAGQHGMRERARLIGGRLSVWSAVDFGTEVELSVLAARAYAGSPSDGRSWFMEKLFGKIAPIDS